MTDDKGSGEGMDKLPEDLFRKWWLNNSEVGLLTHSGIGFHAFTSGFNAGRKAEIARCLAIVRDHQEYCDVIQSRTCLDAVGDGIRCQDGK